MLRVVQTSKEFWFFSINHLGGPLSKRTFTCDWCILIHFGCFCVARFDRPVSGNNRSVFFTDFSDLSYSYLMSASCPRQKFHSLSRFPSLFLSSLESCWVLFLRAKLGERVALWFALTPPPVKWLTEQKNPLEVCKRAARYNKFGCNTRSLLGSLQ